MRQEELLKEKYGTDPGFRVPEGYFEQLNACIMESLPAYPAAPKPERLSAWHRIRPYVYLAAMFAGIWVMMKVFYNVSDSGTLSIDNPPAAIVQAMENGDADDYTYYSADTDYSSTPDVSLEEEVSEHYESMADFAEDFGYELEPAYSAMKVGAPAPKGNQHREGNV